MDDKTLFIKDELSKALFRFSNGEMTVSECEEIAMQTAPKLDFSKPGLSHKGVNWCAKQMLAAMKSA